MLLLWSSWVCIMGSEFEKGQADPLGGLPKAGSKGAKKARGSNL